MPKLNKDFATAQERSASEFKNLQPGVYMCRVMAVRTEGETAQGPWTSDEKMYVKLVLDIAEGDFANYFSDDYWQGEGKDWGHCLYMSWKSTAYGMLKHTFASFDECNAGFDAQAAFEADKWELFVDKFLLVAWNGEEYESNMGDIRMSVRPDRAVTDTDKVYVKVKKIDGTKVDADEYTLPTLTEQAAQDYSDVPF